MSDHFTPKVLAGTSLIDGDMIYRTPDGHWTPHRSEAEQITDRGRAKLLLLQADAQSEIISAPHLADICASNPVPIHFQNSTPPAPISRCLTFLKHGV